MSQKNQASVPIDFHKDVNFLNLSEAEDFPKKKSNYSNIANFFIKRNIYNDNYHLSLQILTLSNSSNFAKAPKT